MREGNWVSFIAAYTWDGELTTFHWALREDDINHICRQREEVLASGDKVTVCDVCQTGPDSFSYWQAQTVLGTVAQNLARLSHAKFDEAPHSGSPTIHVANGWVAFESVRIQTDGDSKLVKRGGLCLRVDTIKSVSGGELELPDGSKVSTSNLEVGFDDAPCGDLTVLASVQSVLDAIAPHSNAHSGPKG